MSKYRDREYTPPSIIPFEDLEIIKKLLETKKLTEKQREAIKSLLQYYYSRD